MRASRVYTFFFLALVAISFFIKLIWWDDPYWGVKYGRQITTLDTIEIYSRIGIDLLKTYTYWTPLGWQAFVLQELPIYQAFSAWVSTFTETVLSASRGVNLFFALLTIPVVFQIAAIYFCRKTAIYATLFFAYSPLNLMYQSATLMDVSTTFFASLAYWLLSKYFEGARGISLFFTFLAASVVCILTKPLYFLPSGVLLVTHFFQQWGWPRTKNLATYVTLHRKIIYLFALTTLVMFFWIEIQKEINPDSKNMTRYVHFNLFYHLTDSLFYLRIIFRWVLVVLNPVTFLFFSLGVFLLYRDHLRCTQMALVYSIIAYHLLFGAMVTSHEYYLLPIVPFFSVIAGRGSSWMEERIRNDFRIRSNYLLPAIISLGSTICSVLVFSVNFVAAQDIKPRSAHIAEEMVGVLEPGQYAYVYADHTNFPTHYYVTYNRTAKLKYFMGLISKEQFQLQTSPMRSSEIMNRLKVHGNAHLVFPIGDRLFQSPKGEIAIELDVEKIQTDFQGHLRYLIFYRFTEETKKQIKNKIKHYQLTHESANWLVYDLAFE